MLFASIAFPFLASFSLYPVAVHSAPVARQDGTQLCTGTDGSGFCSGFLGGLCFNLGGGGQFSLVGDLTGCKGFPNAFCTVTADDTKAGRGPLDLDKSNAGNLIGNDQFSFQCGGFK
ncbi:hypothetical protein DFH09DRAFT_1185589 [Mycena vulgaris]|nr:hypothetical protein DFH09DRAFT_1372519 [Mycena vulgaris]KAJ6528719.1 hypothetical protein DFH09DRAFT_1185589 [Mycena vulgaris]